MMYVVSGRLSYLSLSTLWVVCLYSVVSRKFFTVPPFIPWLRMIYPFYVGEPQAINGTPYVWWIFSSLYFILKHTKLPPWVFLRIFLGWDVPDL